MHILMFSMTPLYAGQSMGGAQKQLKKVALYLGEHGHRVTILCTRRHDVTESFRWHENVTIEPVYRFKQPYPEPYATDVYNIAAAIQETGDYLRQADVFYSHDGGLIFPYVYQDIPAVISLRSVLFAETLQSGFLFQGDALILPSQHTADCWIHTAGRFFPALQERIQVIHNGLDWQTYRPVATDDLAERLAVDPEAHDLLLYPHRPEDAKGIRQAIQLMARLVHKYGHGQVRLLVPQWIDTGVSMAVRAYYDALRAEITTHGLQEHIIFHEWIGDADMPAYYSMGSLTLVMGNYVETFGNTPYESLACGTPALVARVAAYRDILRDEYVDLYDYGDVETAARIADGILREKRRTTPATRTWLHENFSQEAMVQAYADIILNAKKQTPLPYQHRAITPQTRFRLAPWCYVCERGVYHDFRGHYADDHTLLRLLAHDKLCMEETDADHLMHWYREGYLVPLY